MHQLPSLFDIYLQRSKEAPLSLVIRLAINTSSLEPLTAPVHALLQRAMANRHRWEDVEIAIVELEDIPTVSVTPSIKDFSISLDIMDMPMLKRLCIIVSVTPSLQGHQLIILAPSSRVEAILLGTEVEKIIHGESNNAQQLGEDHFPNLHTMTLTTARAKAFAARWTLLHHSPSIEHLKIDFRPWPDTEICPLVPSIGLSNLQSLYELR